MVDIVTRAQEKLSKLDASEQMKLLFPSGSFMSKKLITVLVVCGVLLYLFFGDKASIIPGIVQIVSIYLIVQGCVDISNGWVNVHKAKHLGIQTEEEDIKPLPPP
jgi:hypothetical protein